MCFEGLRVGWIGETNKVSVRVCPGRQSCVVLMAVLDGVLHKLPCSTPLTFGAAS